MNKVTIAIGTVDNVEGTWQNNTRRVEFVGEEISSTPDDLLWLVEEKQSYPTYFNATLYRTDDDRLLVHLTVSSKKISPKQRQFVAAPRLYILQEVTEIDLGPGGRFEKLGAKHDFRRPLTLNEALTDSKNYSQSKDLLAAVKKLFAAEA